MQKTIEQKAQHAVSVVCDLSDLASVRCTAAEIIALNLPIVGLLNNAGIHQMHATKNAQGWDMTFATNHLGPFALTEALVPHLPDGANVVFVCSGTEDPERKAAVAAGFRGGRQARAKAPTCKGVATAERGWRRPTDEANPGNRFSSKPPSVRVHSQGLADYISCLFIPDSAGAVTPGSSGPLAIAALDGRPAAHLTGRGGRPEDRLRVPGRPG
jgi:hypothetical protein